MSFYVWPSRYLPGTDRPVRLSRAFLKGDLSARGDVELNCLSTGQSVTLKLALESSPDAEVQHVKIEYHKSKYEPSFRLPLRNTNQLSNGLFGACFGAV